MGSAAPSWAAGSPWAALLLIGAGALLRLTRPHNGPAPPRRRPSTRGRLSATIRVTLPDGQRARSPLRHGLPGQIAEGIGAGLGRARRRWRARVNGLHLGTSTVRSRPTPPLAILTEPRTPTPSRVLRHSSAHIMATAVRELFPRRGHRVRPADRGRFLLRLPGGTVRSRPRTWRASRPRWPRWRRARTTRSPGRSWTAREANRRFAGRSAQARGASSEAGRRRDHHVWYTDGPFFRTSAAGRTSPAPAGSSTSGCCPPPAPIGGATSTARCSSGSTARRGSRRRRLDAYLHRPRGVEESGTIGRLGKESWTCSCSTRSPRERPFYTDRGTTMVRGDQ